MSGRICAIILFVCLALQLASAIPSRYRDDTSPDYVYNFSASVFQKLPPMPDNLIEVANKYKYAEITARVVSEDYYLQPEFYPAWFLTANETYKAEPRMHGVAGYSIYPSTMDVYVNEKTENITVYAILHASWGVEVYQGVVIKPIYNETIFDVEVIEPDNVLLLPPTYPYFERGWAKKIVMEITIKKPLLKREKIIIKDEIPPEEIDKQWKEQYGNKYRSGGSLFELQQPRLTINIIPTSIPSNTKPEKSNLWLILLIILLFLVFVVAWCKLRKKYK